MKKKKEKKKKREEEEEKKKNDHEKEQNCPGRVLFAAIQSALDNLELKVVIAKQKRSSSQAAKCSLG